uniref:Uncharacterized protein n=1 Tax=Arion vulgaris TaxID=1028688 RepID=A0A0B7C6H0_9EUPU
MFAGKKYIILMLNKQQENAVDADLVMSEQNIDQWISKLGLHAIYLLLLLLR